MWILSADPICNWIWYSTFAIPISTYNESVCFIKKNSDHAEFLWQTFLIIWDETPMQHHYIIETVNHSLYNIQSSEELFRRVVIVWGDDFAQTLSVIYLESKE